MTSLAPTVLIYGTPQDGGFWTAVAQSGWGLVLDNGRARDVIFTMYENFARADALVLFPDAHPAHLLSVLAEAEVGHPLILQGISGETLTVKPIIFFGGYEEWEPLRRLFSAMREQGLLRSGFDHAVTFATSWEEARHAIERRLPESGPSTRLHYYAHSKKQADLTRESRPDVRPPAAITVACFGSASTADSAHLARADAVARLLAANNWNILHGGGTAGVMGQLSRSGAVCKAYVTGVTVDASGAPKISFERNCQGRPDDIDQQIASKDMLHRIETYAGHSFAFAALDGGIGSLQEILVVAELLRRRHPVVYYATKGGALARKPLLVLNAGGCYAPLFDYLRQREERELRDEIIEVMTPEELGSLLQKHFLENPPQQPVYPERPFREAYARGAVPYQPFNLA